MPSPAMLSNGSHERSQSTPLTRIDWMQSFASVGPCHRPAAAPTTIRAVQVAAASALTSTMYVPVRTTAPRCWKTANLKLSPLQAPHDMRDSAQRQFGRT